MKTPWFESSPGALETLLETDQFIQVDCYTFTLSAPVLGVSVLRYSAGDHAVTANGITWGKGLIVDGVGGRAKGQWRAGLDVPTWQIAVFPRAVDPLTGSADPDTIGSAPFLKALSAGALDGALVTIDRTYSADWPRFPDGSINHAAPLAPTGILTVFGGRVGSGDAGRSAAVITVNGHVKALANVMPRRLYQAGCIHTLFDAGCTLKASDFAVSGTVTTVSADGRTITASLSTPSGSGTYALGKIVMGAGASDGFSRGVRSYTAGSPASLTLLGPFPLGIAPGDPFTAYPGCDLRFPTCMAFGNAVNFGGCLSIPAPETAA